MRLNFTKMQATGNDFVVIDNRDTKLNIDTIIKVTPKLCNRTFGVGADGTLFLCRSDNVDFRMVYRNADGSDAGMCGNGGRALSLFASNLGMGDHLTFEVHGVPYTSKIAGNHVELSFDALSCVPKPHQTADGVVYEIFTGTEHVVVAVPEEAHNDLELIRSKGRSLRNSTLFAPKGTNVNFCTVRKDGPITLSTYERGVEDRTLACGTGAIATAVTSAYIHEKDSNMVEFEKDILSPGGLLRVSFKRNPQTGAYYDIRLFGEAKMVFEGHIDV